MSYDAEAIFDDDGLLKLNIGNYLDTLEFKSTQVNFESGSDFNWRGQYFNYFDTAAENNHAVLSFLAHDNRIFGTIQVDHRSYQIYDLTGGILVLAEYNMEDALGSVCGVNDNIINNAPMTTSPGQCKGEKLKILVIYTNGAAALVPDIWGQAHHGINQIIWTAMESNANITYPELAGVEVVNLSEGLVGYNDGNRIQNDIISFKSNPTVVGLRAAYKADIVVFMTRAVYGSINGTVQVGAIGCDFDDAFAISNINHAVSGRKTFAHEVMHLFGARHDSDGTFGDAHGYVFKANGKFRYTLMADLPANKSRFDNISNPNVNYMGKPTGTYYYNVNAVNSFNNSIVQFYSDAVPFNATMSLSAAKCNQYGTATVTVPEECKGTFTYNWQYSDNGVSWFSVPGGTTQTISTFVPYPMFSTMNGTFNSRQYRVTVSSSYGSVTANGTAYFNCPSKPLFQLKTQLSLDKDFKIYPNPVTGLFNLSFDVESENESASIQLIDVSGRVVKQLFSGSVDQGLNNLSFKKDFDAGIYFIKIDTKSKTFTGKLMAQ